MRTYNRRFRNLLYRKLLRTAARDNEHSPAHLDSADAEADTRAKATASHQTISQLLNLLNMHFIWLRMTFLQTLSALAIAVKPRSRNRLSPPVRIEREQRMHSGKYPRHRYSPPRKLSAPIQYITLLRTFLLLCFLNIISSYSIGTGDTSPCPLFHNTFIKSRIFYQSK